jgi:hypothetical protein
MVAGDCRFPREFYRWWSRVFVDGERQVYEFVMLSWLDEGMSRWFAIRARCAVLASSVRRRRAPASAKVYRSHVKSRCQNDGLAGGFGAGGLGAGRFGMTCGAGSVAGATGGVVLAAGVVVCACLSSCFAGILARGWLTSTYAVFALTSLMVMVTSAVPLALREQRSGVFPASAVRIHASAPESGNISTSFLLEGRR